MKRFFGSLLLGAWGCCGRRPELAYQRTTASGFLYLLEDDEAIVPLRDEIPISRQHACQFFRCKAQLLLDFAFQAGVICPCDPAAGVYGCDGYC